MRLLTLRLLAGRSACAGSCAQEWKHAATARELAAAPSLIPKLRKAQGLVPVGSKDSIFKIGCAAISLGGRLPRGFARMPATMQRPTRRRTFDSSHFQVKRLRCADAEWIAAKFDRENEHFEQFIGKEASVIHA